MKKQPRREGTAEVVPFGKILVATDCTPPAEWAVERAARLPISKGGKLIIAHVLSENTSPKYRKQLEKEAQRYLEGVARRIESRYRKERRSDVSVSTILRAGSPYREIIHLARTEAADLIVLGKHGHHVVRDLLLGSTAEKIIHHGDIPVLIVNRKPSAAYRRPAVALDLEDTARTTLELALRALGPKLAQITVIHAYAAPFEGAITHQESDAYSRACRREAVSQLRETLHSVDAEVAWDAVVRFGDPRNVIIREVRRHRVDVVILGTHGRSGLSHFLLGSVAAYVIRSAKCDVLVARPQHLSFALP